jgi:hypothetical protein
MQYLGVSSRRDVLVAQTTDSYLVGEIHRELAKLEPYHCETGKHVVIYMP